MKTEQKQRQRLHPLPFDPKPGEVYENFAGGLYFWFEPLPDQPEKPAGGASGAEIRHRLLSLANAMLILI